MASGTVGAELWRTEQLTLEERTTDPEETTEGAVWVRTDIAPAPDQIASLCVDRGDSVATVPVYDLDADTEEEIAQPLRLEVDGSTGFVPFLETGQGAACPYLRQQHGGETLEAHDNVILDGNDFYAIGGRDGSDTVATTYRYNGVGWLELEPAPTARDNTSGAMANGDVYVTGGWNSDESERVATVEKFDGTTWTTLPDMPTPRDEHATVSDQDGNIYTIGGTVDDGDGGESETAAFEKFDGEEWTTLPDMPTPRRSLAAVWDNEGDLYALGGENDGILDTVELWDGDGWTTENDMPVGLSSSAAVVDSVNQLWLFGGNEADGPDVTDSVLKLFPAFGMWYERPPITTPRRNHVAVAAGDGHIYMIGGEDEDFNPMASVDVWNHGGAQGDEYYHLLDEELPESIKLHAGAGPGMS